MSFIATNPMILILLRECDLQNLLLLIVIFYNFIIKTSLKLKNKYSVAREVT